MSRIQRSRDSPDPQTLWHWDGAGACIVQKIRELLSDLAACGRLQHPPATPSVLVVADRETGRPRIICPLVDRAFAGFPSPLRHWGSHCDDSAYAIAFFKMSARTRRRKGQWGGARRGAGRPRLSPEERQNAALLVRLRPAELRALHSLAESAGSTVGVYAREILRRHLARTTRRTPRRR